MENPLDGGELFGRRSLEEGSVIEMSQTGTFGFTYRPDVKIGKKLWVLFSSFRVRCCDVSNGSNSFALPGNLTE